MKICFRKKLIFSQPKKADFITQLKRLLIGVIF